MRITNDTIIEGTAAIEKLPISNNSLSAIVQVDGDLFKRELGTISTSSKESYIPGLSVSFPSIFNLNTESLDYHNQSLVVSLKKQLQGTAFMAPIAMNGTPSFRSIVESDLLNANVVFKTDNTFVKKTGDVMTGPLEFSNTNGILIKNGASAAMSVRDMSNITSGWSRYVHRIVSGNTVLDTIGHYGGGSNIHYGFIGGTEYNQKNAIRWTPDGKVGIGLSGSSAPSESLDVVGTIKTNLHGTSENWKQAYDRGDFRVYGLGTQTTQTISISSTTNRSRGFYEVSSNDPDLPDNFGGTIGNMTLLRGNHLLLTNNNTTGFGTKLFFGGFQSRFDS